MLRFLITGIVMISLCFIGYGYQKITKGEQAFEDEIRSQLRYPIHLDEAAQLTYAAVKGFNILFNIEINLAYDETEAVHYNRALFGSFMGSRYCHPTRLATYSEAVVLINVRYPHSDKQILFKNDLFYLCGITIIHGK